MAIFFWYACVILNKGEEKKYATRELYLSFQYHNFIHLVLCGYILFPNLKKLLREKRFKSNEEIITCVYVKGLEKIFSEGLLKLEKR